MSCCWLVRLSIVTEMADPEIFGNGVVMLTAPPF